jgi:Leucine-rich repeat (LRR) protein
MKESLSKLENRLGIPSGWQAIFCAKNSLSTTFPMAALPSSFASSIVELHLSHNVIKTIAGLENMVNLCTLDYNQIAQKRDLRAVSGNKKLLALFLNGNPIASLLSKRALTSSILRLAPHLRTLNGQTCFSPFTPAHSSKLLKK